MSTTTIFNMTKDVAGYNGFGVVPSNVMYGVQLLQNAAQSFTLPNDSSNYLVIFTYLPGANVFVDSTTTAAAYSTTIGAVTSELNPVGRQLKGGTTVSLISPDTGGAYVQAAVYVCPNYIN